MRWRDGEIDRAIICVSTPALPTTAKMVRTTLELGTPRKISKYLNHRHGKDKSNWIITMARSKVTTQSPWQQSKNLSHHLLPPRRCVYVKAGIGNRVGVQSNRTRGHSKKCSTAGSYTCSWMLLSTPDDEECRWTTLGQTNLEWFKYWMI